MATQLIEVKNLKDGDIIDLEGDRFAFNEDDFSDVLSYLYLEVFGIENETPECTRVDTDLHSYGFPPNHKVRLIARHLIGAV